jgi:hypothetical protein
MDDCVHRGGKTIFTRDADAVNVGGTVRYCSYSPTADEQRWAEESEKDAPKVTLRKRPDPGPKEPA